MGSFTIGAMNLQSLGIHVFERGWLSSNNILCVGDGDASLIDTGYVDHADQTVSLVKTTLGEAPLVRLINTHLHSDHCGGNGRIQEAYPDSVTWVPRASFSAVQAWDQKRLTFEMTGQACARFLAHQSYSDGHIFHLGGLAWSTHAAAGHDPEAMLLFQPENGILISGDALWRNGLGVIFPELDGADAFDDALKTLDLIESIDPKFVVPGHGPAFSDVEDAIMRARTRIKRWAETPETHSLYGLKVLVKFKLLSAQRITLAALTQWALATPYMRQLQTEAERLLQLDTATKSDQDRMSKLVEALVTRLVESGAARVNGPIVINV